MKIGKPTHFDLEMALKVAQMIVDSDNVVGAMKFIDECLLAYYREHSSDLIQLWKNNVWKRIATVSDYVQGESLEISIESCLEEFKATRFQILDSLVKSWNEKGRVCHVIDMGPGPFTVARGLVANDRKFTYKPLNIGKIPEHYLKYVESHLKEKPDFHSVEIFVCFEMIEHLFHPDDVINFYHRENINAEHVLISTPHGSLGGGWKRANADLVAHVRDWTAEELINWCRKHWNYMNWQFADGPQMCILGSRING